ncbi:hypothetical protein [Antarcticirhabdus aurantiaca]|uniref:Uncharacterized protein n=1 Tax=Antarcticirhabdus aurantiaca TaxID=2606717 RepID=A0ACD4NMK5_9HYPH|nr:hypothetical protein [Antarcticirhabdus aurantiaca]WAJ27949.1 hypothetical protein OXU80_24445 [Jeongeuplla avenae]
MIGTVQADSRSVNKRDWTGEGRATIDAVDRMRRRVDRLGLDLSGLTVVTEAATGIYAVTATIAAMANASRVFAIARDSALHGRFEDAAAATLGLAASAGVSSRIEVARAVTPAMLGECDILTNSGHLRPIGRDIIDGLPRHAVIALMFEAWEFRESDLDLAACREKGIRVAAVNERHPLVGVFAFLGPLCAHLLADSGLPPDGRRILLLCDNPFAPFIERGLSQAGASVSIAERIGDADAGSWDAVVIALDPGRSPPLGEGDLARLASIAPGALLAQVWGDVDRLAAVRLGLVLCPPIEPARGHMGILLSSLGHEPVIRLQAGGLRAAELVRRGARPAPGGVAELL